MRGAAPTSSVDDIAARAGQKRRSVHVAKQRASIAAASPTAAVAKEPEAEASGASAMDATPVPEGWTQLVDENTGSPYYRNTASGETSWVLPAAQPLPPGWSEYVDERSGATFWLNAALDQTVWTRPTAGDAGLV